MSLFPLPVPPKDAPYTDFCDKGGRFGPHNTNLEYHLPDVEKQANLVYLTYFNAGLRIFDIEDPRMPKEVGWFIPPTPTKRIGPIPAKARDANRRRSGRHARQHLHHRQAVGTFRPALHRQRRAGAHGQVTQTASIRGGCEGMVESFAAVRVVLRTRGGS